MSSTVLTDPRFEQSDGERLGNEITELCGYIYAATHGTAHHVERLVAQYRRAKKLQDVEFANELCEKREVTYYYDHDGCLVMKARIPADQGELIIKALEMAMEDTALEEPIAARRADALTQVAETYMNNGENSGSTADRYQVVVHVGGSSAGDAHLDNGPHVYPKGTWTAETSRRIACNCSSTTIKEDEDGEPLSIGRRSRSIPPPMRRALKARDGGCRFPGCTNHKYVDGHHIIHWANGGETSLDNLVLLCRHHHHLVHEGGLDCKRSKDGEIWFEDRRSRRLDDFPMPESVELEKSMAWMYREFEDKDVSAETPVAKWYAGEQMDWDYAVSLMFTENPHGPM